MKNCTPLFTLSFLSPSFLCAHAPPGYLIEKKERGKDWTKASVFPVPETQFTVLKLNEGSEYEFRVSAVNDGGPGKPSKATPKHVVRDPICELPEICFWLVRLALSTL